MTIEDDVFKKYSPDFEKLISYGFSKKKDYLYYEKSFIKGEFKAEIKVLKSGKINGKVIEIETDEEFLPLRAECQQGAFIGKIREEYKKMLSDIRQNCFVKNYFIYQQANRIANLIIAKYGDEPIFMWDRFPDYGVFKNSKSSKWYGLIGNINYSKLGKASQQMVEILNLKLNKDKIQELIKKEGFYPAWHMNKQSWITLTLDETLCDNEIMNLVEESYFFTVKK